LVKEGVKTALLFKALRNWGRKEGDHTLFKRANSKNFREPEKLPNILGLRI